MASLVIETMTSPTFTTSKRPDEPTFKDEDGVKFSEAQEKLAIINYGVVMANYIDYQLWTRSEERP